MKDVSDVPENEAQMSFSDTYILEDETESKDSESVSQYEETVAEVAATAKAAEMTVDDMPDGRVTHSPALMSSICSSCSSLIKASSLARRAARSSAAILLRSAEVAATAKAAEMTVDDMPDKVESESIPVSDVSDIPEPSMVVNVNQIDQDGKRHYKSQLDFEAQHKYQFPPFSLGIFARSAMYTSLEIVEPRATGRLYLLS